MSFEHCLLNLLGEKPLAADFRKRPILNAIARGLDHDDLEPLGRKPRRGDESVAHFMRLRERQRAAARTDAPDAAARRIKGGHC
jgi:hypothetical protein